jgi:hypothetical protein
MATKLKHMHAPRLRQRLHANDQQSSRPARPPLALTVCSPPFGHFSLSHSPSVLATVAVAPVLVSHTCTLCAIHTRTPSSTPTDQTRIQRWVGMRAASAAAGGIDAVTIELVRKRTIIVYESRTCHRWNKRSPLRSASACVRTGF